MSLKSILLSNLLTGGNLKNAISELNNDDKVVNKEDIMLSN
jgi:hypothetical protein